MYQPETEDISDATSTSGGPPSFLSSHELADFLRRETDTTVFNDEHLNNFDNMTINSDISSLVNSSEKDVVREPAVAPIIFPNAGNDIWSMTFDATTLQGREMSFMHRWSPLMSISPGEMARNGFFFEQYPDRVRCYNCWLGIQNISPHVDLEARHYYGSKMISSVGEPCSFIKAKFEAVPRNPESEVLVGCDLHVHDNVPLTRAMENLTSHASMDGIEECLPTCSAAADTGDADGRGTSCGGDGVGAGRWNEWWSYPSWLMNTGGRSSADVGGDIEEISTSLCSGAGTTSTTSTGGGDGGARARSENARHGLHDAGR